jgi:hypothetical protein
MTHGLDKHCSDEELLLEYYGESSESAAHLSTCAECGARFHELKTMLNGITLEPPDRSEHYGLEVWQAIRHRLPARQPRWHSLLTPQWGLAAAAALLPLFFLPLGSPRDASGRRLSSRQRYQTPSPRPLLPQRTMRRATAWRCWT